MIRYVTRWALSRGILEIEGDYDRSSGYFHSNGLFVPVEEAFDLLDEAQAEARRMADRKVLSLQKQIAKLADPAWRAKVIGMGDGR